MTEDREEQEGSEEDRPRHPILRSVLELVWSGVIAVGLALFITHFVGGLAHTIGPSMEPTLVEGDVVLTQFLAYHPRQGDVVMARSHWEDKIIVKRVIATGGQHVEIDYEQNQVRVDGEVLEEPYIKEAMTAPRWDYISELDVPEDCCFLMGDNRNVSADSRDPELGPVHEDDILGRGLCVIYPFDHFILLN